MGDDVLRAENDQLTTEVRELRAALRRLRGAYDMVKGTPLEDMSPQAVFLVGAIMGALYSAGEITAAELEAPLNG